MSISGFLKGILNLQKKVELNLLPSQGLFYKDDFELYIKKADISDIIEYEYNYVKDDLGSIIARVKRVVEKNLIFKNGYTFDDIKSVDVIFLFLEIVRFSKSKPIEIDYIDELGEERKIEFNPIFFNYYKIDESLMNHYDSINKEFEIDKFRYSLPTIGVENSLTNFLIDKSRYTNSGVYNDYSYDFTFFVSGKSSLTFSEIENLIQIFNFDLDEDDRNKVKKIVNKFQPLQKYSLIKNSKVIDINSKIDLENIWK
jgi:hypothetical protein